mmetsp:Transcript_790/g.3074  ORF Transcript_790/g.3074 Transcript_790/m.3074 type:complete len:244 (+) Transcript_790:898-1629(+)
MLGGTEDTRTSLRKTWMVPVAPSTKSAASSADRISWIPQLDSPLVKQCERFMSILAEGLEAREAPAVGAPPAAARPWDLATPRVNLVWSGPHRGILSFGLRHSRYKLTESSMQSHSDHTSLHLSLGPAEGMVNTGERMKDSRGRLGSCSSSAISRTNLAMLSLSQKIVPVAASKWTGAFSPGWPRLSGISTSDWPARLVSGARNLADVLPASGSAYRLFAAHLALSSCRVAFVHFWPMVTSSS